MNTGELRHVRRWKPASSIAATFSCDQMVRFSQKRDLLPVEEAFRFCARSKTSRATVPPAVAVALVLVAKHRRCDRVLAAIEAQWPDLARANALATQIRE